LLSIFLAAILWVTFREARTLNKESLNDFIHKNPSLYDGLFNSETNIKRLFIIWKPLYLLR
jgi:hypothetical protein